MVTPNLRFHPRGLFINGTWTGPLEGQSFAAINPSTLERLPDVPQASAADVDHAVQAAASAFREWRRVPLLERARCVELLRRLKAQQHGPGKMS